MSGKRISDEDFLDAIVNSKNITQASESLGISRQAIYNRMRNPEFCAKLQDLRNAQLECIKADLTSASKSAVDVMLTIVNDESSSKTVRLKAAQSILSMVLPRNNNLGG